MGRAVSRRIPAVGVGSPSAAYQSEYQFMECDGLGVWVHESIRPARPDRPICVDLYSILFLKHYLVIKNAAEILPF